jgi:tetratricopeptide (TPR) repeat protein
MGQNGLTGKLKTPVEWTELHLLLEKSVMEGQHHEVKKVLNGIGLKSIPRAHICRFSEIAWRIGYPIYALKLLHSTVFPENSFSKSATDKEKINYASALVNLGAIDEAIKIFDSIDPLQEPETLLRKSFAYFKKWNYKGAMPWLFEYVKHRDLPPYKRVVGKVNMAAALIEQCEWERAQILLAEIQDECRKNAHLLLLGNCLELQAQIEIFQHRFDQALPLLEEAKSYLQNQNGSSSLFVEKWLIICRCFKGDLDSMKDLIDLKNKSLELSNWETVRECDLFEAIVTQNEDLVKRVLLGTPSEHYRKRVRRLFGKQLVSRGNYYLALGCAPEGSPTRTFSPYEVQKDGKALHNKPQLLALFEALTMDFYKPSHIGLLFQRVYPDEKFNPFTSPDRVLILIKRLNQWFIGNELPIRVHIKKSEFALISQGDESIQILVHRAKKLSKEVGTILQLKHLFDGRTFSVSQVSEKMKISRSSAQRVIDQAIEAGHLAQRGSGRPAIYQIVSRQVKRSAA